jgi:hypothetical protein
VSRGRHWTNRELHFAVEEEMKIVNARQEFCTKRIISVDNKFEFLVDIICIVLRVSWCDFIVPNAHARMEDESRLFIACFFICAHQSTLLLRPFKKGVLRKTLGLSRRK